MKEILHHKYSLFQLEGLKFIYGMQEQLLEPCFKLLETFETLEEAQDNAKHIIYKTIILPSYE